jgi:small subunit ribosomal protein S1
MDVRMSEGLSLLSTQQMGTFDDEGNYVPRVITEDNMVGTDLATLVGDSVLEFEDGDLVMGTVVKIDRDEVLLDIGFKSEGVIPSRELSIRNDVDPSEIVSLGERVECLVLQKEDKEGRLVLSKKRAQYEKAWSTIEELKNRDEVVKGVVIEVVKGGLIVDIGLRGFLPASLVELRRVRELQPYIGKTVEAKIIELDRNRNNVVLSRRAWLEETQKEQRGDFLNNLKPGERRHGVISSVVNFGAFVDLGGMDGLIHVSELSWKHIDHPSQVVAVGDEVDVEVLDVDFAKERISLSLKATQSDPWQVFAESHAVDQLVYGRVTKLVPFGAFVQVGEGIEGLVHISELAAHHVDTPDQVVTAGEELWVKIIELDTARRRISLSVKQAAEGGEVSPKSTVRPSGHTPTTPKATTSAASSTASSRPRPRRRPPGPSTPPRPSRSRPSRLLNLTARPRARRSMRLLLSTAPTMKWLTSLQQLPTPRTRPKRKRLVSPFSSRRQNLNS